MTWAPAEPSSAMHNASRNIPLAMRIVLPMRSDLRAALAWDQRAHEHVQDRDEDDVEERREEHSARHRRADRMASFLPGATGEHQRHDAQDEGEGRHQDRPQPDAGRLDRRFDYGESLLAKLLGELDDQDRVLRRQADQHDEPDLAIE